MILSWQYQLKNGGADALVACASKSRMFTCPATVPCACLICTPGTDSVERRCWLCSSVAHAGAEVWLV